MQIYVDDENKKSKKSKILLSILIVTVILVLIGSMIGCYFLGVFVGNEQNKQEKDDFMQNQPLFYEVYELLKENYYKDISWEEVQKYGAAGMIGSLDSFSGLGYALEIPKPILGISIKSNIKNEHYVSKVEGNSPASEAGIMRGDKLLSVINNGEEILLSGISNTNLSSRTDLLNQNTVDIKVQHTDGKVETMRITKEFYTTDYSDYTHINENTGLISLSAFSEGAENDFANSVQQFLNDVSVNNLIVDLRDNGGGSTIQLAKIASFLIKNDTNKSLPIIKFNKKNGTEYISIDINDKGKYIGNYKPNFKLSILINDGSASASEALLGAVRYYNPSTIVVGSPTYGKGVGQSVFPISNGKYYASITTGTFDVPVKGSNGELKWENYHTIPMQPSNGYKLDTLSPYANADEFSKHYNNDIKTETAVLRAVQGMLN